MKILYIVQRFHTNLYYRVKALKEAGHEVFVLVEKKRPAERYDLIEPIVLKPSPREWFWKIIRPFGGLVFFDLPDLKDLYAKILEIKPDVLIARNLRSLRSFFALRFARKINCRSFAEVQTSDYPIKNSVKRFFIRIVLFFFGAKGVITPIGSGREEDGIFNYLPFAIETKDFDKIYLKDEKINIITVGKFIRRKGHLLLLRALKSLSDKVDWRLTIVGQNSDSAYRSEVEEFIIKSGLSSQIEIKAEMKNEEVLALYREQDLFILPAWNEPAAYSVLEAMAAKLPVIASDDNGTSSYIKEGENGYVFKNREVSDLTEKISAIVADCAKLQKMGGKSFVLACENHSLEKYRAKLEKIINSHK